MTPRLKYRVLTAAILLPLCTGGLRAQDTLWNLRLAQRVRVKTTDAKWTTGRFVATTADSLVVTLRPSGERRAFGRADVQQIEASVGHRRAKAVGVGMFVGLLGGVGLGLVCVEVCASPPGSGANMAPAGGLLLGPPIGGLIGALLAPDRWRPVRLWADSGR